MRTSYPCCFAAWRMRSMFSTVLFSLTLWPTAAHAAPFSLRTSFCGSMKTTAVSFRLSCMMCSSRLSCRMGSSLSKAEAAVRRACREGTARPGHASGLQKLQQIAVHLVLVRRTHAVRGALVDLERSALDQLGRAHRGRSDRDDLVVVPVQDERRHVELPEIRSEISLRERLDAEVGAGKAGHHPLAPERLTNALGDIRAGPVVAVEGHAEVLPELRAVGDDVGAQLVEHLDRQAAGIGGRLQHDRRDGT